MPVVDMRSALASLVALMGLLQMGACDPSYLIAQEAVTTQSYATWFEGLPTWHVPTSTVPASPAVPEDSPARDMVFGVPLTFSVFPVNPTSSFAVEMTFLDDGGHRIQSLAAGRVVLAASLALPSMTILDQRWDIPSSAVAMLPNGEYGLTFTLQEISGPNAIVSSFALYSSNASDPFIQPPRPPYPTHDLPRLTPRPVSVDGTDQVSIDLMGTWNFNPNPSVPLLDALRTGDAVAVAASSSATNWSSIVVPGEYTLQGFIVPTGQPVVYETQFALPSSWMSLQVKLRCDGVYSNASVFVNGKSAGAHLGGFTPFELDITNALVSGTNTLTIVVTSSSLADTLASANQYAAHDLGGITRKIYLLAVPEVSIADVHVITSFVDSTFGLADLILNISLANDNQAAASQPYTVAVDLHFGDIPKAAGNVTFVSLAGQSVSYQGLVLSVANPALWDPEHPNLHNLTLSLSRPGQAQSEIVVMRIGFRSVQVVSENRIAINGRVIKARGTTRHETHPLVGRSLWTLEPAGKQWERDIIAFRDMNINYIRTSHYPPAEELMIAADELGMLIELEMPFCWASGNTGSTNLLYTVQAQREAMVFNRNHPSVIHWSLGNESPWTENFNTSLYEFLYEIDSTRPFMFDGGSQQPIPPLDILSVHYPDFSGPATYANGPQPTLFGEYAHLNCYNRRELVTDPGVRDIWGLGIEKMWELIYASPGTLGACYWAGIDDIFYMPPSGQPVGYGEWGLIDGWRRAKPETFLVQNIYSPVKLQIPASGSEWAPNLVVSNRHDFTDLAEVSFVWTILETGATGLGVAFGGPHTDSLSLTLKDLPNPLPPGSTMQVNATSPRGFLINAWTFPISEPAAMRNVARRSSSFHAAAAQPPSVVELPDGRLLIQDQLGAFAWLVEVNGSVSGNSTAAGALLRNGPVLMVLPISGEDSMQLYENMPPILPFNDPLTNWRCALRNFTTTSDAVVVTVQGAYANASGTYTMSFNGAGALQVGYKFTWTQASAVTPRQIGLVFGVPGDLSSLSWRRNTPWTSYPADHIGRPQGDGVPARPGPAPGNQPRTCSWSEDQSPLGDNDFRSTKHNITVFELEARTSRALSFVSDGTQHGRAWVGADGGVYFLAADLSNEGGNPFSREKVLPNPTVSAGTTLSGSITLQLGSML